MFKKFSAILLVFALLASFAACKKLEGNEFIVEENAFVVDDNGITQELQTRVNEEGKTEYYYTDNTGNTVVVDKNKVEIETTLIHVGTTLSNKELEDLINNPEKIEDLVTEDITEPEFEMSDGIISEESFEEIEVEIGNDGRPVIENTPVKYEDIIKSGTYTMDFTIKTTVDGQETVLPVTVMQDGKKLYFETVFSSTDTGKMRVNMLINDDGYFIIIPILNAYYQVASSDAEGFGDVMEGFDFGSLEEDLEMNNNYDSSANVNVDGKTYRCDIYTSDDGTTVKYYYLNGELKRMETVSDGSETIIEFKTISGSVNKTKFRTPKGTDLGALIGSEANLDNLGQLL